MLHISKSTLHRRVVTVKISITDEAVDSLGSLYRFAQRSLRIKDDQCFVLYAASGFCDSVDPAYQHCVCEHDASGGWI
jgi:hypothetical protein